MLYSEKITNSEFKKTIGYFTLDSKYPEKYFENFSQWMDISQERDYSLLADIHPYREPLKAINSYVLCDCISRDSKRKKFDEPDEFTDRFIIFGFKLVGYYCYEFAKSLSPYYSTDYIPLIQHAFASENLPESKSDSDIVCLMAMYSDDKWKRTSEITLSIEAAERAAKVSSSIGSVAAAFILDNTSDIEVRKRAIDIIKSEVSPICGNAVRFASWVAYSFDREPFDKCYFSNISLTWTTINITKDIISAPLNHERCLLPVLENPEIINEKYISDIFYYNNAKDFVTEFIKRYPDMYLNAVKTNTDIGTAIKMFDLIQKIYPEKCQDTDIVRREAQKHITSVISAVFDEKYQVMAYLKGEKPFNELDIEKIGFKGYYQRDSYRGYYKFYKDDFIKRVIVLLTQYIVVYYDKNPMCSFTGFECAYFEESQAQYFIDMLFEYKLTAEQIANAIENVYGFHKTARNYKPLSKALSKYNEVISKAEISTFPSNAHIICVYALAAEPEKYKSLLFGLAEETNKHIKSAVIQAFSEMENDEADIMQMLSSKKVSARENAVAIIENKGTEKFQEALEKQFEKEKSEKLKLHIAELIGKTLQISDKKSGSGDIIAELTKGQKAKKVAWLFEKPFTVVHNTDGSETEENILKALLMCFAAEAGKKNLAADKIAENITEDDLKKFAAEVLGKWLDNGAEAKTKWVLYFSALYGGMAVINSYVKFIKEWSENLRGALAGEAVRALAFNGSSAALLIVDNMARKYKNKQVKRIANETIENAANMLLITKEEFADKIVPDLGFDENMCRVFDYGQRKFNVYINRELKLEVYNGDKKIKDIPKPGVNDDSTLAEKSYAEYKEMKKLMKSVVTAQTARLEYVLMCDRKWTKEGFNALFVKNPVMHCFAEGLIWGIYKDGSLSASFRYMEDGSFTTSDEEEFEIPDDAVIGLVHPIELSEDELKVWQEQLSDYEITQPFPQLSRKIYRKKDSEFDKNEISRFEGETVIGISLNGKLLKSGWTKGYAEDAGAFYSYSHIDETGCTVDADGKMQYQGYVACLEFSGMYIQVSFDGNEDVDIEKLKFYDYNYTCKSKPLEIKDVPERYFSEIMKQIYEAIGTAED